ncbi:MAG: hypothetical protein LBC80_02765 [Treponema sp.]|jgi:hypothetical protein|nr:hypothetical protein [Treponema sp.]
MIRIIRNICLCFFITICFFWNQGLKPAGALELEVTAGLNQKTYPSSGSPHSKFEPFPFIIGNLSLKNDISSSLSYVFNIERDNVLQNSVDFRLITRIDNYRLEFGPFIGVSNNLDTPDLGIIGSIEVTLPGILFLSFGGSSTVGAKYNGTSNNFRETIGVSIGFWLPFAITTFSVNTKSFTQFYGNSFDPIRDNLIRYELNTDFFGKITPVSFGINTGYQTFSRTYHGFLGITDELGSFFAGFKLSCNVTKPLRLILGAEIPFRLSANSSVTIPEDLLYKMYAGFSLKFF